MIKLSVQQKSTNPTVYQLQPDKLQLGAQNANLLDTLHFTLPSEWSECTVRATFIASGGQRAAFLLSKEGTLQVSEAITRWPSGVLLLDACNPSGMHAYTNQIEWLVATHSTVGGSSPVPHPDEWQQLVQQVQQYSDAATISAANAANAATEAINIAHRIEQYDNTPNLIAGNNIEIGSDGRTISVVGGDGLLGDIQAKIDHATEDLLQKANTTEVSHLSQSVEEIINDDLGKKIYADNLYSNDKRFENKAITQSANCLAQNYMWDNIGSEVIGYFPCEQAAYDLVYNGALYKSFAFVMGYDENGNPTGRLANTNGQFTTNSKGYICLQINSNSDNDMSKFAIVKHFDGIDYTKIGHVDYKFIEKNKSSKLFGKKIAVLGDSISTADHTLPTWWQMIAEETGCEVTNYSVGGTTIAYVEDRERYGQCFADRFQSMADDFDLIFVMGGTNDQNRTPLGNWRDNTNTTLYGALNILIEGLITKYPNATILFATPIQTKPDWTNGYLLDSYVKSNNYGINSSATMSVQLISEIIKQKCRRYAIPCKDMFNESGITGYDESNYRDGDTLHPSAKGQKKIKVSIQHFLESNI